MTLDLISSVLLGLEMEYPYTPINYFNLERVAGGTVDDLNVKITFWE